MIKISVIMPSYNVAGYIEQCLKSVCNQTLKDIEIICVDAYSMDGTVDIIEKYAALDDRIRVIYSDYKSYGRQMNIGISEARGKYIGIVETDDFIEADMYETLYYGAENTNADIAKGEYFYTYDIDGIEYDEPRKYVPKYLRYATFSPRQEPYIHKWESYIWNGIYNRKFLLENGIRFSETQGAAYQDIGFKHRVLNAADRVIYFKKPMYHYRCTRPGSSTISHKGLDYAFYEYKSLLNEGVDKCFIPAIYTSIITSMLREFKKQVACNDEGYSKSWYEPIKWLKSTVKPVYNEIAFSRMLISDEEKEEIDAFLNNTEEYLKELREKYEWLIKWRERLVNTIKGRYVVIAGLPQGINYIRDFFMRNGIKAAAITSDNPNEWGKNFGSLRICNPDEVVSLYEGAVYFILDKTKDEVLLEELTDRGVKKEDIIVVEDAAELVDIIAQVNL